MWPPPMPCSMTGPSRSRNAWPPPAWLLPARPSPRRAQLAQTSRKTFKLGQRLTPARVAALKAFWDGQQGGVVPFLFYNLAEGAYDPTGNSTQGRYTVVFRGNWSQATDIARTNIQALELVGVA